MTAALSFIVYWGIFIYTPLLFLLLAQQDHNWTFGGELAISGLAPVGDLEPLSWAIVFIVVAVVAMAVFRAISSWATAYALDSFAGSFVEVESSRIENVLASSGLPQPIIQAASRVRWAIAPGDSSLQGHAYWIDGQNHIALSYALLIALRHKSELASAIFVHEMAHVIHADASLWRPAFSHQRTLIMLGVVMGVATLAGGILIGMPLPVAVIHGLSVVVLALAAVLAIRGMRRISEVGADKFVAKTCPTVEYRSYLNRLVWEGRDFLSRSERRTLRLRLEVLAKYG